MSRCLPFSSQEFVNRGSNREASIKLQKEKDETKTERRRGKKEKKSSKRDDKHRDRKRLKTDADEKAKKLGDPKKKKKSELCLDSSLESVGYKSEQLERSDITEEHDQPSCSGSVCNFLDSIDSSNKRKRQDEPINTPTQSRRTIFRIRMPLKKHDEPKASAIEQPKTHPVQVPESSSQVNKTCHATKAETKVNLEADCPKPSRELPLPLTLSLPKRTEAKISEPTLSHKTLIEDWVMEPPSLYLSGPNDLDDEDWLSSTKPRQQKQDSCSRLTASLWPRATLFSEVDIFALPFTVPY